MNPTDSTATPTSPAQAAETQAGHKPRSKGPSITLAICLAAGIAAGIGLARPGAPSNPAETNSAQADAQPAAGYGAADQADAPAATPQAAPAAAINILDFAFGNPITVTPGSAINVTNSDGAAHTLTSNDGLFDTGSLGGGATTSIAAPGQPGTYSFFCSIHPSMQGSVTVTQ